MGNLDLQMNLMVKWDFGEGACGNVGGWEEGRVRGDVRSGWLQRVNKKVVPGPDFLESSDPGPAFDDPDIIGKEIFLIPFFPGNFFENSELLKLVYQIIRGLVTDTQYCTDV